MEKLTFNAEVQHYPLTGISPDEMIDALFREALKQVNEELKSLEVTVFFMGHDLAKPVPALVNYRENLILGIEYKGQKRPISIFDLKALDEKSIKTVEDQVNEMKNKVLQHLAATKTKGILFSSTGTKFDSRVLQGHQVLIDEKDYLIVDGHRIAYPIPNGSFLVLKAGRLASYTMIALVNEDPKRIRMVDSYDLVRLDNRGMYINVETVHQIAVEALLKESQEEAIGYTAGYYLFGRDQFTDQLKERLYNVLTSLPSLG